MSGSDYQVRLRKVMKNPLLKRRQFVSTPHNIYTYFKRKRRRQINQYCLFYSSNIQKERMQSIYYRVQTLAEYQQFTMNTNLHASIEVPTINSIATNTVVSLLLTNGRKHFRITRQ